MSSTYKQGRIVLVLNGRFSGCKAAVIGNGQDPKRQGFDSVYLIGIQEPPRKIVKKMNKKMIMQKSKIKVFLKNLNKNHLLPTRYTMDLGEENNNKIKNITNQYIQEKNFDNNQRIINKYQKSLIKNLFLDKFLSGKNKWFFSKLRI
nr:60S ribosomal protein L27 [Cryptomonas sp.]